MSSSTFSAAPPPKVSVVKEPLTNTEKLSDQKSWTTAMLVMGVSFGVLGGLLLAAHFAPGAAHLPNNWVGHTITWMQQNSGTGILLGGGALVSLGSAGWGFREFRVLKAQQKDFEKLCEDTN